jgi:hypothetical protein
LSAEVAEGLAEDFEDDFDEDLEVFEEDLDFAANERGASERQRTPAIRRERSREAFIIY